MTSVGRWIYARHLQVGDVVQSRLTGNAKVTALELSYVQTTVYNFLVDVLHNYAVGHGEVLVHNNNGMGEKAPLPEKSDHAKHQAGQGRPTGPACSDAQNVPMRNLFVQDDGRYVVIGANGRVHIFEADGTHVTSFWNSATNTKERLAEGRWSLSSLDEYEQFKSLF